MKGGGTLLAPHAVRSTALGRTALGDLLLGEVLAELAGKLPLGRVDGADEIVRVIGLGHTGQWKLWTAFRDVYPEEGERAAIAKKFLEQMGRTQD
eukprot:g6720.t1